jgi:hypothetical protein
MKEPLGSFGATLALHKDIEYLAVSINGTPEIMQLARMRMRSSRSGTPGRRSKPPL